MDLFLIGLGPTSPTQVGATLETPGHGARLVRDWSSLTADDTFWGVVVDASDARSALVAADELDLEVRGLIRLVPDRSLSQPGDWVTTMVEVLPTDPPPPLEQLVQAQGGPHLPEAAFPPDAEACDVCGWIEGHDPGKDHSKAK